MSEGGYIQGAGDDSEGWSNGLTAELFWKNRSVLFQASEDELPGLIARLIEGSKSVPKKEEPALIKPTQNMYLGQVRSDAVPDFDLAISCSALLQRSSKEMKVLNLKCPAGKLGSRELRKKLPEAMAFVAANKEGIRTQRLLLTCSTGRDLSVGVALAVLCTFYDDEGKPTRPQNIVSTSHSLQCSRTF